MFIIPENWQFWTPVDVTAPDKTTARLQAQFAIPANLDWDSLLAMHPGEALDKLLIDWKDVCDHRRKPIAFSSRKQRQKFLSLPFVYKAFIAALLTTIENDIEKN